MLLGGSWYFLANDNFTSSPLMHPLIWIYRSAVISTVLIGLISTLNPQVEMPRADIGDGAVPGSSRGAGASEEPEP